MVTAHCRFQLPLSDLFGNTLTNSSKVAEFVPTREPNEVLAHSQDIVRATRTGEAERPTVARRRWAGGLSPAAHAPFPSNALNSSHTLTHS